VKVKYRTDFFSGTIDWYKPFQLKQYQEINRETPVYIILGVGNRPHSPCKCFLIPVHKIKYASFFKSFLRNFETPPGAPVREDCLG